MVRVAEEIVLGPGTVDLLLDGRDSADERAVDLPLRGRLANVSAGAREFVMWCERLAEDRSLVLRAVTPAGEPLTGAVLLVRGDGQRTVADLVTGLDGRAQLLRRAGSVGRAEGRRHAPVRAVHRDRQDGLRRVPGRRGDPRAAVTPHDGDGLAPRSGESSMIRARWPRGDMPARACTPPRADLAPSETPQRVGAAGFSLARVDPACSGSSPAEANYISRVPDSLGVDLEPETKD